MNMVTQVLTDYQKVENCIKSVTKSEQIEPCLRLISLFITKHDNGPSCSKNMGLYLGLKHTASTKAIEVGYTKTIY